VADFDSMTRPQLVKACTDRSLPSYGTKADLVARLLAAGEAASAPTEEDDPFADAADDAADPELEATQPAASSGEDEPAPSVQVFTADYEVDDLDDEEHAELCARVVADARDAGFRTRGGGRRLSGAGRFHSYGVSVR